MKRAFLTVALAIGAVALVNFDAAVAQGRVVDGRGCGRQATYELCVKCNQQRGAAGATGGYAWCSRVWRPRTEPVRERRTR